MAMAYGVSRSTLILLKTSQVISSTCDLLLHLLYDRDLFLVGVEKRIGLEPSSMDAAMHQQSKSLAGTLLTISIGFDVS